MRRSLLTGALAAGPAVLLLLGSAACDDVSDVGPPTLAEKRAVWRRHAALVLEHSPEKMRVHEVRKTLAWYSRGLFGGSQLRQRGFSVDEAPALLDMGEAFFADLEAREAGGPGSVRTAAADAVAKSIARNGRRDAFGPLEAHEVSLPCAAAS